MGTLKIMTDHINRRRLVASFEAEMIARGRNQLALSEALLRQPLPSLFLGSHPFVPWPKLEESASLS
ncbi:MULTISPECIES: hypothetical protein [Bradyrhizobium]|uniref:hypothetical protein n=1 Tax=Bradyrhizobium TaxID=374 RepID=UPI000423745B|nr:MULTISPECIES: hypothetical protein [Bradyrhizobium]KQT12087.1 hypothetical protein ASG57_34760 [Bradyrhizobium sp. Leaf396]